MCAKRLKRNLAAVLFMAGNLSAVVRAGSVVTDGSVGAAQTLAGPNFAVTAGLGRQMGGNLFQSFSDFQLSAGEVATFSGPAGGTPVTNILARVTGGTLSDVNGTIRSTIPGANFYLINPAGVVFGPGASLNVSGSFFVTSADVVKLSDGGSFNASHPVDSLLSTAAPAAFGFLSKPALPNGGNPQGEIGLIGQNQASGGVPALLAVPTGKSISLIGGNLFLVNAIASAPSGNLNLVSVSGSGDVKVNPADPTAVPDTSGVTALGFVGLQQGDLTVDGAPGGRIAVRAGSMLMEDSSSISSDTSGGGTGGGVDLAVTGLLNLLPGIEISSTTSGSTRGGPIKIDAGSILLDNSALSTSPPTIQSDSTGSGASGDLNILTNNLTLINNSFITSGAFSSGAGGAVRIESPQINISGPHAFVGAVSAATSGGGETGAVTIVTQKLSISDSGQIFVNGAAGASIGGVNIAANSIVFSGDQSGIGVHGTPPAGSANALTIKTGTLDMNQGAAIDTETFGANNAGAIAINATKVTVESGSTITAATAQQTTGNSAPIDIASDILTLDTGGTINSSSLGAGSAGMVSVHVGRLTLSNAAEIGTFTGGAGGQGGDIDVQATSVTAQTGGFLNASTINSGNGGNIVVNATHVLLNNAGSGIKAPAVVAGSNGVTGAGGNVTVHASDLTIKNGAQIRTSSEARASDGSPDPVAAVTGSSGPAGTIDLQVQRLRVAGTSPGTQTGVFSQASLQKPGTGGAGSITIHAKEMTLLPGGNVSTNTSGPGDAGAVTIRANHVAIGKRKSAPNSAAITSASTGTGHAGSILIHTPGNFSLRQGGTVGVSAKESSAGDVTIDGGQALSVNHGLITAQSSATGGNITLRAQDLIQIRNSTITAQAGGNGGKIFIDPNAVVLVNSTINGLSGGQPVDVQIVADGFLQSESRILTNTNEQFPVSDIAGSIANLGTNLITGAAQLQPQCGVRFSQQSVSSFVVTGRGGEPPEAGSWIPDFNLQPTPGIHR